MTLKGNLNTLKNPSAGGDAGHPKVSGAIVNWIGDSISPALQASPGFGPLSAGAFLTPTDFLAWAHLLSNGRILYGKAAGITAQYTVNMIPRIDADALSMGGSFCGITTGTNDASFSLTPATFAANIRIMCASIVARGQIPILTTLLPHPAQSTTIDKYRRFMIAYAGDNGWPLVDWYSKLVDPASATNAYLSGYDLGDGIHPTNASKKIMGQALVDALTPYLPPWTSPVQTSNGVANANLLTNSQFATDTNSDGTPDNWSKSGPGTVSLVTDAEVNGRAMRLVDASGSTVVASGAISGTFGGHRIAFTGLIKNPGAVAYPGITLWLAMGARTLSPMTFWTEPYTTWQRFYMECVAPASLSSMAINLASGASVSGVDVSLAQLGVFDLTACGI